MAVGDEIGVLESTYHELVGRYVSMIEVLNKRIIAKDQHIANLERDLGEILKKKVKSEVSKITVE